MESNFMHRHTRAVLHTRDTFLRMLINKLCVWHCVHVLHRVLCQRTKRAVNNILTLVAAEANSSPEDDGVSLKLQMPICRARANANRSLEYLESQIGSGIDVWITDIFP